MEVKVYVNSENCEHATGPYGKATIPGDLETAKATMSEGWCPLCKKQFVHVKCPAFGEKCACHTCPCCRIGLAYYKRALDVV